MLENKKHILENKHLKEKSERKTQKESTERKTIRKHRKENQKEHSERNTKDNFIEFGLDPTYGEQLYIFLISDRNYRWNQV